MVHVLPWGRHPVATRPGTGGSGLGRGGARPSEHACDYTPYHLG